MTRSIVFAAGVILAAGCSAQPGDGARSGQSAAPPAAVGPAVAGKAPAGAVVTLTPVSAQDLPMPEGPAIMDQYAKQFVPDLLLVRVGQSVEFRNSEDSPHNVTVTRLPTGTEIFNVATAPYQKHVHTFQAPGQYAVSCDIHPGMLAAVVATTTPYSAVADAAGTFTWPDVAPGQYTLGWIVNGKSGEKTVTVTSGRTELTAP